MSILYSKIFELSCCYKGGGGGGGSSGAVDFPAYMKTVHGEWLDNTGADTIEANQSVTALIKAGIGASPYTGETAYNPDTSITAFITRIDNYETLIDALDETTLWNSYITNAINATTETVIDTSVAAHAAILSDRLTTEILPRFQTGMRDINAVISSSFVLGQAIIEGFNERSVADYDGKLRVTLLTEALKDQITLLNLKLQYNDAVAKTVVEANRIKVVMKKEQTDEQLEIDSNDYKWELELYQYGANILSSISGSAISTQKSPSKGMSSLGGALSGAAAGAVSGNPFGVIGGAVIGGIGGLF